MLPVFRLHVPRKVQIYRRFKYPHWTLTTTNGVLFQSKKEMKWYCTYSYVSYDFLHLHSPRNRKICLNESKKWTINILNT